MGLRRVARQLCSIAGLPSGALRAGLSRGASTVAVADKRVCASPSALLPASLFAPSAACFPPTIKQEHTFVAIRATDGISCVRVLMHQCPPLNNEESTPHPYSHTKVAIVRRTRVRSHVGLSAAHPYREIPICITQGWLGPGLGFKRPPSPSRQLSAAMFGHVFWSVACCLRTSAGTVGSSVAEHLFAWLT